MKPNYFFHRLIYSILAGMEGGDKFMAISVLFRILQKKRQKNMSHQKGEEMFETQLCAHIYPTTEVAD